MTALTWHDAYYSDLQSLYALLVVPMAFLAFRLAVKSEARRAEVPAAAPFVAALTLVFAIETMLDPIATGPISKIDAIRNHPLASVIPFAFVLLGDLRVLLLAIGVARPDRTLGQKLLWALGNALIVPIVAGGSFFFASWIWPNIHSQALWMLYEFGFLCLCIFFARSWVPRLTPGDPNQAAFLRSIFGFSAAYYLLWLVADVLIVVAEMDLGWAIRMVPNQLYYAFWAPFVYWRFFSALARTSEPS